MSQPNPVLSSAAVEHLRWSLIPGIGPILFNRIVDRFGSAQKALGASAVELASVDGIGLARAADIAPLREVADVQREVDLAAEHGARILCREDEEYPVGLRHLPDPPICLYVRGRLEPTDALAVAIVGSRRCSLYGREQAYRFGHQLGSRGVTVVSGLARGVDGESHKGALASGGRTVAVLGNGLAHIYPPEHRDLADAVAARGAIISELPMETSPAKENFLPRNRLIAGLSLGVLVVEAAYRSGALSTSARAAEYNREVFAIPGRLDSDFSTGTNALIRDQHAKLVTNADDILDELGEAGEALKAASESGASPTESRSSNAKGSGEMKSAKLVLSDDERKVFEALHREEQSIEMLAAETGHSAAKIASTLITLQLKGLARQLPGNLFVRTQGKS
jgi:DNA processing protein